MQFFFLALYDVTETGNPSFGRLRISAVEQQSQFCVINIFILEIFW